MERNMRNNSPFSADDRSRRSSFTDRRTIGELDTSYQPKENENVKHVAVRDVSGSFSNAEPMHAFMVPSEYLKPDANRTLPPKRPLGQKNQPAQKPQPMPMYSEVATFGLQPRIRRERMMIPVKERRDEPWTDKLKKFAHLIAALFVAGALFIGDKLSLAWDTVSQKLPPLPFLQPRNTYSVGRGIRSERMGMRESLFRVIAPVAAVLVILAIGIFSGLVSDTFHSSDRSHQAANTADQTSNGASGGSSGQNGKSNPNPQSGTTAGQTQNATAKGTQGGAASSTQPAGGVGGGSAGTAPSSSSGGSGGSAQTTSGGSGGGGGGTGGGIDPAGVTITPPTTPSLPVNPPSIPVSPPSLPSVPIQQPSPPPVTPPSLPSNPIQPIQDTTKTLTNTVQNAPQTLKSTVQSAPQTLNNATGGATSGVTGGLGL
jgi:hypothetical protein